MAIKADYETRPFSDEVWGSMKQLRRERYQRTWEAQAAGGICVTGIMMQFMPLLAGFGTVANPTIATGYTRLARKGTAPDGLRKYVDLMTAKGYSPVCGAIPANLGQLWEGISFNNPITKKEITPDFIYLTAGCPPIMKGSEICAEHLGLPILFLEMPPAESVLGEENRHKYILNQLLDAIEWVEKRTGKKYDDEKLIESVRYQFINNALWAKISDLCRNIPSPMSAREAASLHAPVTTMAFSNEITDYLEALYVEMQERVRDGISGSPFERKRLSHQGMHPMYRPDVLRWPEEYGASFIIGFGVGGGGYTADGRRVLPRSLEERGIELKTREDALRALIDGAMAEENMDRRPEVRRLNAIRRLKDWHIDGAMFMLNRRCAFISIGMLDSKSDLEKAGIITGSYEASEGDPNEFSESIIREDFARFFERLGLLKIE
ncbi:2-hydroxyacyl-CoA dehydratase [Chloroflexota bacterium]